METFVTELEELSREVGRRINSEDFMYKVRKLIVWKVKSEAELFICFADFLSERIWNVVWYVLGIKFKDNFFLFFFRRLSGSFFHISFFSFFFFFHQFLIMLYFTLFFHTFALLFHFSWRDIERIGKRKLFECLVLLFYSIEFKSNRCFFDFFIKKEVCTLAFTPPMLASKTINFNVMRVKLSNSLIIKFNPSIFAFFNVAEIVTKLSASVMQDNSF